MDLTTLAIIGAVGLALLTVTVLMLNRAWGDFPTRAGMPDDTPPPAPSSRWPARDTAPADNVQGDQWGEPPGLPAGASSENLVPIQNAQVKRLIGKALEQAGSAYAPYFLRHGEQLYLVTSRIADPAERARVAQVFHRLNNDQADLPNMTELFRAFRQLGK